MLRKLLKYDMISVGRYWWILAVSMVGLSLIGGIALRLTIDEIDRMNGAFGTLGMIVFILCVMGLAISTVFTPLLVFIRYYKHFFTDEGYLTFTLPVRRRDLLHAKTLNALIWTLLYELLMVLCVCIIAANAMEARPIEHDFFDTMVSFFRWIGMAFDTLGIWAWVYVLELILIQLCATLLSVNLIHFCITLGSVLVRRGKLFLAIGFYYGFNAVLSGAIQVVLLFNGWQLSDGFFELLKDVSFHMGAGSLALMLLLVVFIVATPMMLMYCLTRNSIERKLNLA